MTTYKAKVAKRHLEALKERLDNKQNVDLIDAQDRHAKMLTWETERNSRALARETEVKDKAKIRIAAAEAFTLREKDVTARRVKEAADAVTREEELINELKNEIKIAKLDYEAERENSLGIDDDDDD